MYYFRLERALKEPSWSLKMSSGAHAHLEGRLRRLRRRQGPLRPASLRSRGVSALVEP